jgi:DNA-binding protein HU-beta
VNAISKVTGVITFPARTALGAASVGVRTTARVLGWAAHRAGRPAHEHSTSQWPSDPVTVVRAPDVDPMAPTRIPPRQAPATKAPARKVPAGQVPLKSAPTPSLPAALRAVEASDDVTATKAPAKKAAAKKTTATTAPAKKAAAKKTTATTAPAKKAAATKAPAKKTAAKKAPSKQAAVLAPALGITEAQAVEVTND